MIVYETNGGATTAFGLICRLKNNDLKLFPARQIYVEYPSFGDPNVIWEDEDTLIINGNRIENVLKDKFSIYHTRHMLPESTEG